MYSSKKDKWILFLSCCLYTLEAVCFTAVIYLIGQLVDFGSSGDYRQLIRTTICSFIVLLLDYLVYVGAQFTRLYYQTDRTVRLNDSLIKNILMRSLPGFREKNDAYYLNLFSTDMDLFYSDYLNMLTSLFSNMITILFMIVTLSRIHLWLLAISVFLTAVPLLTSNLFISLVQKNRKAYSDSSEQYTNTLKEIIEGYEVIRMESGGGIFQQLFHKAGKEKMQRKARYYFFYAVSNQFMYSITLAMQILGTAFAAYLILRGELTAGMLVTAVSYFGNLTNNMSTFIQNLTSILSTKDLRGKLEDECSGDCEPESRGRMDDNPLVEYDGVSFSFGERKLYEGINCRLQPGGCYAIVGESGSGKSTLMKLLLKYYDGYTGTIRLAGQDIRQLSGAEIYSMVGVVNQTPYLFNASLYDNITMFSGEPKRDSKEYRQLLQDLNLTELAARVGDEALGDFGDNISGGERQRISIARTMRNHPSIVIFDEPTTGLDPENVRLIQEFIFRHDEMTRIVITHDWSEEYLGRFEEVIQIGIY